MPLSLARVGEVNYIKRISGKDEVCRHLASLGFVAGECVTVISEISGNIILGVKDSRVAMDRKMASKIIV